MSENENKNESTENEYAYKSVMTEKKNSHIWSVISICLGVLSVILSFLPILSIIVGIASIGFAIISRQNLGYFEKLAIVGLIIGIFGIVFGAGYAVFDFLEIGTDFI